MVKLTQHSSSEYAPRTFFNAGQADITIAFAVDFLTAGEILTKKACGKKPYLPIRFPINFTEDVENIIEFLTEHAPKVINIAGNSIHTLDVHYSQDDLNYDIYHVLNKVTDIYHINKIVSGGQTGVDWAAGVACQALGINCEMTFPNGYRQRNEFGVDTYSSNYHIRLELKRQAERLKKHL